MRGRKPKVNWTPSLSQYTVTIDKKLHRLGIDEEDAERQYRLLLEQHDLAVPVDANPTFGEIADQWLEHVRLTQDPERFRLCKGRINEFLAFLGRDLPVRDLRPVHVEKWLESKPNLKAEGSKRLYKAMILACLNWAASAKGKEKTRLIAFNPLRGKLRLPEGESRGGEAVWPQEVFDLVIANSNPQYGDFLRALAWTGARPSTVRKVEAGHYNAHLKVWDVESLYRGRLTRKKYVRRIWLSPSMVKLVERLNEEWPEGPIFRTPSGRPFPKEPNTLIMHKLRLRLERQKTPLPKGISIYGLRHTFATRFLVEHPDKIEYLRELLGHKDLTMILKHYGHLIDQHAAMHGVLKDFRPL
jgi:integrase